MNTIVIITLVLVLLPLAGFLVNHLYINWKLWKLAQRKFGLIQPLLKKLGENAIVGEVEIFALAAMPSIRHAVYRTLETYGRLELFPETYMTRESAAESFLVTWLEYPTELGKAPDEIELLESVVIPSVEPLEYYVFKYRTLAPHWASQYDWMLGVCGPYRQQSVQYEAPLRVFSRFNEMIKVSPSAEAEWVHNNISGG